MDVRVSKNAKKIFKCINNLLRLVQNKSLSKKEKRRI